MNNPNSNKEQLFETAQKILHVLWNRKWIILSLTLVSFSWCLYQAINMDNIYTSSTRILVQKVEKNSASPKESISANQQDASYYKTQVLLAQSPSTARETAKLLGLKEYYGVSTLRDAAQVLLNNSSAVLLRDTRIIVIRVTDTDPKMAADIANTMAEVFMKKALQDQFFVNDQILQMFPDDAGLTSTSTPKEILSALENEELMFSMPSVMSDPLIISLKRDRISLQTKNKELSTKYTDSHPDVQEIRNKLAYIDSEMIQHARKVTAALKSSISSQFQVSNIKIMDAAEIPQTPSGPDRKYFVMRGTLLPFFLISLICYAVDMISAKVRIDDDLIHLVDVPMLGQVPKIPSSSDKGSKRGIDALYENHTITDAVTTLRTSLIFSMPEGKNKRILFTSSIPSEGKTTISFLIALSLAKLDEKVLFIELDLRKPSLDSSNGISHPDGIGMTDYLSGQHKIDEIIFKSHLNENLDVISAGTPSPNPTSLLTSTALQTLFETMDTRYDKIIIDTPPSYVMPDAIMLMSKAHGVVFVVGSNKSHQKVIKKTIDKFKFINATIFGTTLNQVKATHSLYGSKYGYGHYGAKK